MDENNRNFILAIVLSMVVLFAWQFIVVPDSPQVTLLSPAGDPHAYYAERGFVGGGSSDLALPGGDTLWTAKGQGPLTPSSPITLTYDNGKGLTFTRIVSVDDKYMFTIDDTVANAGAEAVTLYPYGLVSRHELPKVQGFYILLSLIHISEPTRRTPISYAVFCLKKKK